MKLIKKFKNEIAVFLLFILFRLPALGQDIFNTDVWKWKSRIYNFGNGLFNLEFAETVQRYHPGVTLMWLGSVAVKANSFYYKILLGTDVPDSEVSFIFTLHFFQKIFVVLALAVVVTSIFFALRRMFSAKYAWAVVVLLILEPFYTGLTRVVHLEGLLSTFMIASFVWSFFYLHQSKISTTDKFKVSTHKEYLFLSAIFAALAVLTKTSSLVIVPFVGLMFLLHFYFYSKDAMASFKKALLVGFIWFGIAAVTFFLLWPALWVAPVHTFQVLYSGIFDTGVVEGHGQLYFGNLVQDPGFSFYFVVLLYKSSLYLLAGLIGYLFIFRKSQTKSAKEFAFFAFLLGVLYFIEMSLPSKKLVRYLLPTIVSFTLIAGFFYEWTVDKLAEKFNTKSLYIFGLVFLPAFVFMVWIHPNYLAYYNPLLGGLKTGINVLEPKWMIGIPEIVEYTTELKEEGGYESFENGENVDSLINKKAIESKFIVAFPEKYYTQIYPFIREYGGEAVIKDLTPHAKVATYFVYPVWDDDSDREDRFKIQYIGSIKLHGTDVYNVYKRVNDD